MTEVRDSATMLERRELLAGAAATVAASALPRRAFAQRSSQPNILFILADDLGYADLSAYGRRDFRTPILDSLAAEGLLMTQGYSSSAVCSPTRVALITGRYHQRLAVGLPEPIRSKQLDNVGLPDGHPTLPGLLRAAGYRTALIGKWHMGWPPEHGPLRAGYDTFFGIVPGAADYLSHRFHARDVPSAGALYEGDSEVSRTGYLTSLLAERAVAFVRDRAASSAPFLLSLHFTAPHWPWQGPLDAVVPEKITSPDVRISNLHSDSGSLEKYAEMVRLMDAAIGSVLAELDSGGLASNTIVVFTSDNGGERFSDTWPLRGGKGELLEGGIRVPLIVRWPGRIGPGRRSDQVMVSMDWLPTLIAAAQSSPDSAFPPDGMNLLDVITGASPPVPRKLFWRFRARKQAAVRDGNWKYLRIADDEHLFDISRDPRERANRRHAEKAVFERLKQDFAAWEKTILPYPDELPETRPTS